LFLQFYNRYRRSADIPKGSGNIPEGYGNEGSGDEKSSGEVEPEVAAESGQNAKQGNGIGKDAKDSLDNSEKETLAELDSAERKEGSDDNGLEDNLLSSEELEAASAEVEHGKEEHGEVDNRKVDIGKVENGKVENGKVEHGEVDNGKVENGLADHRKVEQREVEKEKEKVENEVQKTESEKTEDDFGRQIRQLVGSSDSESTSFSLPATVRIHNIRSSLPKPEIEMIYTVYKGMREWRRKEKLFLQNDTLSHPCSRDYGF
jgi:hypothetical protein